MSLQTVLEEIKKVKPFAEEEVEAEPTSTLNARRGRKSQSIETYKRLKRDYKTEMTATALFVISTGSGKEDFSKALVDGYKWFSYDPEIFYSDLADRVHPSLYMNKQSVSNIFDVLGRHLEDKMNELDISEYNQLLFKAHLGKVITSPEDFRSLVKLAINEQIGSEIAGVQALTSLVDQAISKGHKESITPIILNTSDEKLALSLLKDLKRITDKVFLVVTGEGSDELLNVSGSITLKEINKNSIKQALTLFQKSAKNNK